jgi:spermidine/putrescine transport system ATP-binding protein/putrescine transport system ATP-binding protein|tara:strand:+ start:1385 stop:2467 length:1083 start_codon:yes stop_codon:yes gene_type:complete
MVQNNFIKLRNISKKFNEVTAVDSLDLDIQEGEFFSLLGPSGCGKTTLLRILAGFEYPTTGNVYIDDSDVTGQTPNLRPSNMVFQNYAIFPHINVQRNIEFGLRKEKLSKKELNLRVKESLKMVQLEGYEERFSNQLSGGQRQRVALARALVKRPKVLLLDEPLGALDKKLREEMQIELRNLQKDLGITFIFVTHDQEEAMTMSDRVAVMNEGKILQISPPKELYNKPINKFVSEFIGNINLLETSIVDQNDKDLTLEILGIGKQNFKKNNFNSILSENIFVALRPEDIFIKKEKIETADINIQGIVKNVSFYGESTYYYVKVEGIRKLLMVSNFVDQVSINENDKCNLGFNLEDIKLVS